MGRSTRRRVGAMLALVLVSAAVASCADDGDGDGDPAGEDGYEATIRRTEDGVPHITGETMVDVVFGQGYASGEDRACDLADQVVKIRGERARYLGPGEDDANVDSDVAWRTVGIFERAAQDWEEAPAEVTEVVTAYTEGWNAHLDAAGVDGLSGWCAGAEWVRPLEPVDVYAYGRSIALLASSGALVDRGIIGTAEPPGDAAADQSGQEDEGANDEGADGESAANGEQALGRSAEQVGSNGWAIGAERSAGGTGMLLGNPHFPWDGELRFWEVHLTVPGELEAYGVQLSGLPGIGIGFNENVGWTHTVSAGNRFTAYRLDLVAGDPTRYRYGDEEREMTATDVTVEVRQEDGSLDEVTRTTWATHYGPVIDFPGVGWTEEQALTFRDANLDNAAIFEQYLGMVQAQDMDELVEVHRDIGGVPLFNTIAVSSEGRAWYADTSATPNLSDDAIAAYERSVEDDPLVAAASDQGAVLLDGSDPANEWMEVEGARSPGLVPFEEMPMLERDDYVFNANDSFWMPHATELLTGDYSPLHGWQETSRSPRTRENATVLDDTSSGGPAGEDGRFTLEELADASLQNRGYTSRVLLDEVVERCQGVDRIEVAELPAEEDVPGLPAGTVEIGEACAVLAGWDGVYDLDRAGPAVWRELLWSAGSEALLDRGAGEGVLWAEPFDPERPLETPGGLVRPASDGRDPVLEWLARAVQKLDAGGFAVDAPLGEVQVAPRAGEAVPIHGGDSFDGTTNVVGWGDMHSVLDPELDVDHDWAAVDSGLATMGDDRGYMVNSGTSFLLALEFTEDGPQAQVFLTYGNPEDREDPRYLEATQRFSGKEWREVLLDPEEIEDAAVDTSTVTG